jgi:hypothetical protein
MDAVEIPRSRVTSLEQLPPQSTTTANAMRDQAYEDVEMAKEKLIKGEIPLSAASPGLKGTGKQLIDGACILLNIASTVTLVFLNKWYVGKQNLSIGIC